VHAVVLGFLKFLFPPLDSYLAPLQTRMDNIPLTPLTHQSAYGVQLDYLEHPNSQLVENDPAGNLFWRILGLQRDW
jgi:hypothetical protein